MDELEEELKGLSDEEKLERIKGEKNDYTRFLIAKSIGDDDLKVDAMELLKYDYLKAEIIITLEEDKRIEQLEKLESSIDKVNVIKSLGLVKRIEQLNKMENGFEKDSIRSSVATEINTLEESERIMQLDRLNDESAKVLVIKALKEKERINQLEKLNDEFMKALVINTLEKTERINQLEKLNSEFAKVSVINTLEEFERVKQLEKLKHILSRIQVINMLGKADKEEQQAKLKKNLIKDRSQLLGDKNIYTQIGLDRNITIGMEIESEGIMGNTISEMDEIVGWETKGDGSLKEGVEVVSPILTDNKEDVEGIYTVCRVLEKCGQTVSDRCGGHIHIGANYLTSKEAYVNLFEIWGNSEEIIYKMCNEKGDLPRMGAQGYAAPISPKLNAAIENGTINLENEEDLDKFISEVQEVQVDRYSGLNLANINNEKNTIEFRIPNGTLNPDTWIENARLFGRIVEVSQELAEIEKNPEKTKEEAELVELKNQLKEEITEQEKVEKMLELLFTEEEKDVYRQRYITNSKLLEELPDEKNPLKNTNFSSVDFKKKKHSLEEFHDVAINERSENINKTTRETADGVKTENEIEQIKDDLEGR